MKWLISRIWCIGGLFLVFLTQCVCKRDLFIKSLARIFWVMWWQKSLSLVRAESCRDPETFDDSVHYMQICVRGRPSDPSYSICCCAKLKGEFSAISKHLSSTAANTLLQLRRRSENGSQKLYDFRASFHISSSSHFKQAAPPRNNGVSLKSNLEKTLIQNIMSFFKHPVID